MFRTLTSESSLVVKTQRLRKVNKGSMMFPRTLSLVPGRGPFLLLPVISRSRTVLSPNPWYLPVPTFN